ncbi:DUF3052 domain-containing protein [Aquimarina sp. AU474]|uniref:DUF3052 domain-containing protein n=1 Tax=Aquimarina sp. AU474 TaxID=2108529 RepID=UPI000D69EC76|nr:DUF3052 domain-containing protein [Aquimarina sp. AU474]
MPSGYSGTPLAKKLGIKEGNMITLYNQPINYFDLLIDLPDGVKKLDVLRNESADFIHIFCTSFKELRQVAPKFKPALKKTGMLWVSWPKGSSNIATDLKRDPIRDYLISIGLVDIKVAAVDDNWSGLKFVYRIKDRN